MTKKKRDNSASYPNNSDEILEKGDDLIDEEEDEEVDESEVDDQFEEDEDDLAVIADLERDDEGLALSEFFFEEEVGYNHYYDWSLLREEDIEKYHEVMNWSDAELSKASIRVSNHFILWTMARACQRNGLVKKFRDICTSLLKARKPRPEICYEDVHLELIQSYAMSHEHKEAFAQLERFEKCFPDSDDIVQWVNAFLLVDSGKVHEGKAKLDRIAMSDSASGRALYEIAMTLISLNHPDLALNYLERAKTMAQMNASAELTTDVDIAREIALRQSAQNAQSDAQ
ncbi:MAG: hypothetical protein WC966_07540 [Bradymonadales bacterium]|jgi:hypothetical protein